MSDNLNDKLNEDNAAAEASRRAEKIRAIRASLHSAGEPEASAPVRETAPEPAEESFEAKFRRVREGRLAAVNTAPAESTSAPAREETAAEAAEAVPVSRGIPAEAPSAEILQKATVPEPSPQRSYAEAEPMMAPPPKRTAPAPVQQRAAAQNGAPVRKKKKKKKPKTLGQRLRGLFPEKGDKPLEIARKVVFLCSLVAIVVCGYFVGDYYLDLWRSSMEYSNIDDIYRTYTPILTTVEETPQADKYYTMLPGAKKLLDINDEVVGYLTIPTIDGDPIVAFPVVQAEDNDKYLNINVKGENSRTGALFLDYRNSFDRVEDHRLVRKNSDNLVVYGHNMADESMFGNLRNYRRIDNYYEKHPIIEFNSNYEMYTYKIFAFFIVDSDDETDTYFDCWNHHDFDSEEAFYDFVNNAKRRTIRNTEVDVKYGDPLLTLYTCNTDIVGNERGRLIIMARRVRPGEDLYEGTKNSKVNPNPLWPSVYQQQKPEAKYDPDAPFVPYGP